MKQPDQLDLMIYRNAILYSRDQIKTFLSVARTQPQLRAKMLGRARAAAMEIRRDLKMWELSNLDRSVLLLAVKVTF